jgi:hypothetical protein
MFLFPDLADALRYEKACVDGGLASTVINEDPAIRT